MDCHGSRGSSDRSTVDPRLRRHVVVTGQDRDGLIDRERRNPASAAVDGNAGTRWSSASTDAQWLQVDLGTSTSVNKVVLNWEAAYASGYKVQLSTNGTTWTDLKTVTGGDGGIDTWDVTGTGRYVRVQGVTRATGYGYSLWEFQVFGPDGGPDLAVPAGPPMPR